MLYVQLAEYDKAEADFEKANELDPSQSLSSAAQGLAAVEANDLDRALATVEQRLARKPDDPLLLYVRADILAQKGVEPGTPEFKTAVSSAQKAVALRPSLAPAHGVLAKLYLQAGQTRGRDRAVPQGARHRSERPDVRLPAHPGPPEDRRQDRRFPRCSSASRSFASRRPSRNASGIDTSSSKETGRRPRHDG